MTPRILIIGLVWPEPTSSAAGWRMLQLIAQLQVISHDIHFATAAAKTDRSHPLADLNITEHAVLLNDASFDCFINDLKPDIVVYDRFISEEQFGWRVKQAIPEVITLLDTEDLHFVRHARKEAYKKNTAISYDSPNCYRELSAIYRCDLSIIISEFEYNLLIHHFKIPEKQLLYLPFIEKHLSENNFDTLPKFNQRKNFIFIGNFIHEPNYETVRALKKMWKDIKKVTNAELHIYGAYPSEKIYQLHNANEGFIIKGEAHDVNKIMQNYRVLLAPIPFGAGLKGKFVDGFKNALPSVTTTVGSEGIHFTNWAGMIVNNDNDFIKAACELYNNENAWQKAVLNGKEILNANFSEKKWKDILQKSILELQQNIEKHRADLFIQKILWQNTLLATKYLSKWIEAKQIKK